MTNIKLNFINQSNDVNNSEVVIFQKNVASNFDEIAVAWKVIKNCGRGFNHPFSFPMQNGISSSDSFGNYTPQLNAQDGQVFNMVNVASGDTLQHDTTQKVTKGIQFSNDLKEGTINANILKDGKLLATQKDILPGQKTVFEFKPTIWIGVVSQVEEGDIMNAAIISEINTEIALVGISSADIIMTGGGAGAAATPFSFTLKNINLQ